MYAKKWILRVYYMGVLKSENVMKLRLSTSGVLVKCFFFTLGHFLAWNPWRKTPNLHIFDQNRIQMHVFQKNWCKHDINFQNKTRFLTKKHNFLSLKLSCYSVISFSGGGFQKNCIFRNLRKKIPFWNVKFYISKSDFLSQISKKAVFLKPPDFFDGFFETLWGFSKIFFFFFRENPKKLAKIGGFMAKIWPKMAKMRVSRWFHWNFFGFKTAFWAENE